MDIYNIIKHINFIMKTGMCNTKHLLFNKTSYK
jgi:hypothetical protein